MTDLDYDQLRRTAKYCPCCGADVEKWGHDDTCEQPPTVIALLDELAAQQKVVEAGAAVIAAQQAHVKNVRNGSDSMIHDTAVKLGEAITPYNVAVKHLDALKDKEGT